MAQGKLEERVAELEKQVAEMKVQVAGLARPTDWRSVVGMFTGDEGMKRIDEAGRRYREEDRKRTRRAPRGERTKAKR